MECNTINSVETCFYNNVFIDTTVVDVNIDIHNNLRLRMLLNKRDASVRGCINSGHLRTAGGASHNNFQQKCFKGNQQKRSSAFTSTSTSKRRTTTSRATNFQQQILDGKPYLQQRLLREQLRAQHGPSSVQQFCWRSTSSIAQPRSSMTFAFSINKWFNNSFVSIDLRSSPLHILSSMITLIHSSFHRRG